MIFLINPLHYALHHDLKWSLARRYPFAAGQWTAPIARSEVRSIAGQAPILLQQSGQAIVPVVALNPEWCRKPLFDANMHWLGPRPPLALRYHPFQLIDDGARPGHHILGVASDPEVVSPEQPNAFFDELARPVAPIPAILRRLQRIRIERAQLCAAAAALQNAEMLTQLPLVNARGHKRFYSIDMSKFKAASGAELGGLGQRPQDALMLAMALDYSRSLHLVEPGARARITPGESPAQRPAAPPSFLVDDDFTMSFDS